MAHDVAETTLIPSPPKGREGASAQISRRYCQVEENAIDRAPSCCYWILQGHNIAGTNLGWVLAT